MAEFRAFSEDGRSNNVPRADADVLTEISLSDPSLAEFYLEVTDMLITDMGWDTVIASRFVLDWAAESHTGEAYTQHFIEYYE